MPHEAVSPGFITMRPLMASIQREFMWVVVPQEAISWECRLRLAGRQASYAVPVDVVKGGLGLSGLYDIQPLFNTKVNGWLRMHPEQLRSLSPIFMLPDQDISLVLAVGGMETDGFKNQTAAYEAACAAANVKYMRVQTPHCNHFNLLCELAKADSQLTHATLQMIHQR